MATMSPSHGSTGSRDDAAVLVDLRVDREAGGARACARAGSVPPLRAMTAAFVPPPRAMSSRPGTARLSHSAPGDRRRTTRVQPDEHGRGACGSDRGHEDLQAERARRPAPVPRSAQAGEPRRAGRRRAGTVSSSSRNAKGMNISGSPRSRGGGVDGAGGAGRRRGRARGAAASAGTAAAGSARAAREPCSDARVGGARRPADEVALQHVAAHVGEQRRRWPGPRRPRRRRAGPGCGRARWCCARWWRCPARAGPG